MKALVYKGPCNMSIEQYPEPVLTKGRVLLRSKAVGICGSDVHGYLGITGRRIPPMIMGHEVVAEVVECADLNSRYRPGDLVFVDPIEVCGVCENCRDGYTSICLNKVNIGVLEIDGAFCEYFTMKEDNLIQMPNGVDPEIGVLAEPFSVAFHAASQLTVKQEQVGTIAIIGSGIIGICTAAIMTEKFPNTKVVVMDVMQNRLERCKSILGSVQIENLSGISYGEIKTKYAPNGFSVVMEAVGIESTVSGALDILKNHGEAVLIGNSQKEIKLHYQQIVTRELRVYGTYGFTHEDLVESVQKFSVRPYAAKMVDKVVSLDEAKDYFDILANKNNTFLKIVVDPTK